MNKIYIIYLIISFVFSFFFTYFAPVIHGLQPWKNYKWPIRLSQWLLNFVGSCIGWIALAYFIFWRITPSFTTLEIGDFIVLIIAFYGITGYLPYILMQKGFPWK